MRLRQVDGSGNDRTIHCNLKLDGRPFCVGMTFWGTGMTVRQIQLYKFCRHIFSRQRTNIVWCGTCKNSSYTSSQSSKSILPLATANCGENTRVYQSTLSRVRTNYLVYVITTSINFCHATFLMIGPGFLDAWFL